MKLSKSELALAKVINENGGWKDANFAAQEKCGMVYFYFSEPNRGGFYWHGSASPVTGIEAAANSNWYRCFISREEYYHAYPKADSDRWIEWNGGECPEVNLRADIKRRDGRVMKDCAMSDFRWNHEYNNFDIIAYRLHKPEVEAEFCESVMRSIPEPDKIEELAEIMGCNADIESIIAVAKSNEDWIKCLVGRQHQSPTFSMMVCPICGDKRCAKASDGLARCEGKGDSSSIELSVSADVVNSKPTIEQLAQHYRNAKDYAMRLQEEADEAAKVADAKLVELELAGKELWLLIGVEKPTPELSITDWRDLKVGDIVFVDEMRRKSEWSSAMVGRECVVIEDGENYPVCFVNDFTPDGESYWIGGVDDGDITWRFIRRP